MTVSATVGIQWHLLGVHFAAVGRIVTLDAEKRHGGGQQAPVYRAMGSMTGGAIFSHITMFVDKWATFFHMAAGANIPLGNPLQQFWLGRTMGIVTVKTPHLVFPYRMMGEQVELAGHIGMTAVTQFGHFFVTDLLLGAFMELMTGKTA